MDEGKIMLLMQLIKALEDNFIIFEKAYGDSDKEDFENSKKALLDLQIKIKKTLS
jgi:hypothetical protein